MCIRVGIGIGSNLGDRLLNLRRARAAILALPGMSPARQPDGREACLSAPVYETDPVDCPPGSAPFLNTVVEVGLRAKCSPLRLLAGLRQIEQSLGRPSRHPRNAPRCIDLDILYAGSLRMTTADLRLPHPRLHLRRFVLAPLAAVRPELKLPGLEKPVNELLRALDDPAKVLLRLETW